MEGARRAFREEPQAMTKHPHSDTKVWRHAAMFPPRVDDPPQGQDRGSSLRRDSTLPTQYLAPIATSETVTMNMPKGPPSSDPSLQLSGVPSEAGIEMAVCAMDRVRADSPASAR